jgi:uncharacterized membrane protein
MRSVPYTTFVVVVIISFSSVAIAAGGPETIELSASMGKVSFPHKKHQEMSISCNRCHAKEPGKIAELGEDWAHKTCKGCHTAMSLGPTSCKDCHKK